jgi:hypothetical protein
MGLTQTQTATHTKVRVVRLLDSINALYQVLKENPTTNIYTISSK